jgi:hypothetical protein
MNSSLFASLGGVVWAAAGIGLITSALPPANALQVKSPTQADNFELASQASGSQMTKDDKKPGDDRNQEKDDDDMKSLPESVSDAIFKDVSRKTGMDASKLRIVKVERETWSDGCLGLGGSNSLCTQSTVPGWRVIAASGAQQWVYRCNQSGSMVKLDEVASRSITGTQTTQITRREEVMTRTTQTSQSVAGAASSQRTQVSAGSSQMSSAASSQSTQMSAGSTQMSGAASTRTQQRVLATRSTQVNFSDVAQSYWAKDFIAELAGRGIFTGFPDGKFHPNEPVTRAQFAALVASVFKKTKVRNAINFTDVSTEHWAYKGIQEAYEMGFLGAVSGNSFNPNQSLTRLEIMTALAKGLNYTASSSTEKVLQFYSDAAAIPASARTLVAAATERGIVANYPSVKTCSPNQVATRADVAAFLHQAMVSQGEAMAISSPYVAGTQSGATQAGQVIQPAQPAQVSQPAQPAQVSQPAQPAQAGGGKPDRQHCNQGIGNGAEGCDPGNSHPHGGSNDETGRTPGKPK